MSQQLNQWHDLGLLHRNMQGHPFNACNHLIVAKAFPVVQLSQPLLYFRSEPFVVTKVGFHHFLHKLGDSSTTLRCGAFKFGFELRIKVEFHIVV